MLMLEHVYNAAAASGTGHKFNIIRDSSVLFFTAFATG